MARHEDGSGGRPAKLVEEQLGAARVERAERLVEKQQVRLMEKRSTEGETLEHSAGDRAGLPAARLPEAEALEEHADPLAALRDPVQAAVEVEVLERRQLPVEQRLLSEGSDLCSVDRALELAGRGNNEPGEQPEQRRLAGSVRARDEEQLARANL